MTQVAVLCGGVGAARFLQGLRRAIDPSTVTGIVNVGDDAVIHGLHVAPDLDTITYTLAGAVNPTTGWGLTGETWQAMEQLRRYGRSNGREVDHRDAEEAAGWFALGDRDLGTHMYRTSRVRAGATLTEVTAEVTRTWGLDVRLLPVTDDPVRTVVRTADGRDLSFQEYFVREHHDIEVSAVRYEGIEDARATAPALDALRGAEVIVIAPSNPIVSIEPVLGVPGIRESVARRRQRTVAVSPIVGGAALKGPADRLLRELGHEASVLGVARWYSDVAGTLLIDEADADLADAVEAEGIRCIVTSTVMSDEDVSRALASTCLAAAADA
ncbi:MAG: 2-phospho-L-lactate transferase [Actinobacteria bacterium]|nr:2-phospho-L-lactate transferase [Actinomycetota bacterium]